MTLELVAVWFVRFLGLYAGLGILFALAFAGRGAERLDPAARGATIGFRLIILPAAIALWPLLLSRWLRGTSSLPTESNAHRRAATREGGGR